MSVQVYPNVTDFKCAVHFSGPNFDELRDVLKGHHFRFHRSWKGLSNVWVGGKRTLLRALPDLRNVEPVDFDESLLKIPSETQLYRIAYKPDLLPASPYAPYQKHGVQEGIRRNRYLLAWEMGMGKTFAVNSILNHLVESDLIEKILILAPFEGVHNFREHILRDNTFSLREDEVYVADAQNREPFQRHHRVVIMAYQTFLMLSDSAYRKLKGKKSTQYKTRTLPVEQWVRDSGKHAVLIADESHYLKNIQARQTRVVFQYKDFFHFRYLLSGTPDPKGPVDLYSQVKILDESLIAEDYTPWISSIADVGNDFSSEAINFYHPEAVKNFMERISPWVDRKFAKDHLGLPEFTVDKVLLPLRGKHLRLYRDFISHTLGVIKEEKGTIVSREVWNRFPYILQALDNPCLLEDKVDPQSSPVLFKQIQDWIFEDNVKVQMCKTLVKKYAVEEGRKVIVWSEHPKTLNQLAKIFSKYNPVVIHGQIENPEKKTQHQLKFDTLQDFRRGDSSLLLASYRVLKQSVDITESNRSIYIDRSFDYTDWSQSIKRSHRIGQTQDVVVHPLIFSHSIDIIRDQRLEQREKFNTDLFNSDSLSQEQWRQIFEGNTLV